MVHTICTLPLSNGESVQIQKNEQDPLAGLISIACGTLLTPGTLVLTAGSVALSLFTAMTLTMRLGQRYLFHTPSPFLNTVPLRATATLSLIGLFASAVAVYCTKGCFANSLYHLGPEYQIVKKVK